MSRRIWLLGLTLLISVGFAGSALALEMGNKRKGKYTYRKIYKACHERGEVGQPKPIVNPDAHTQAEWTRMFEEKNFDEFQCQQEWDQLGEEDLRDIYTYLHDHAFDSPTPAKCK